METTPSLFHRLTRPFVASVCVLGIVAPIAAQAPSLSTVPVEVVANAWYAGPLVVVADQVTDANDLKVAIVDVPSGVSVSDVVNTDGTVTGTIGASCKAVSGPMKSTVANAAGQVTTGVSQITVLPPPPPEMGTYGDVTVAEGASLDVAPSTPPTAATLSLTVFVATTFTGTVMLDRTGVVSIGRAAPVGRHLLTITLRGTCGTTANRSLTVAVRPAGR